MESTPLSPENSSDDTGSAKKKKKAADVATFIIEKPQPAKARKESDSFLSRPGAQTSEKAATDRKFDTTAEKPTDDTEIAQSLAKITEAEARLTFQEIAQGRLEELPLEADRTDLESVEDQASRFFLEKTYELGDPDLAAAETIEALGIELDSNELTADLEPLDDNEQLPILLDGDEVSLSEEEDDEDNLRMQPPLHAGQPLTSAGNAQQSPQGPPNPPNPAPNGPAQANSPPKPVSLNNGYYGSGPNVAPALFNTAPNSMPIEDAEYLARRAEVRGLLVGGIVGYLIGRRRGRIKTQKKLLPVQRKLEKKVSGLQDQLLDTEYQLRERVAKQNKLQPIIVPKLESKIPAKTRPSRLRTVAERSIAESPQREGLSSVINRIQTERIGHMLVGEAPLIPRRDETSLPLAVPEEARKDMLIKSPADRATIEKDVLTMSRTELLLLSEKISIDGANLRQVYETHLLGERGLRRVITEYLRGGDVKRMLRRELVEREIDYERDPILRDRAKSALSGGGRTSVDNLLEQAGVSMGPSQSTKLPNKPLTDKEAKPQIPAPKKRHQMMDVGLGGTILVLIALIIVLLALHH